MGARTCNAPINVKPARGRRGIGWGFDRLLWPGGRAGLKITAA